MLADASLRGWDGFGIVVQALPEARAVRDRLASRTWRARWAGACTVRLVKGAYWDSEIKRAQDRGPGRLSGVHAQAEHRRVLPGLRAPLLEAADAIYPLFATHNAQTIAAIHRSELGARDSDSAPFEFQRLHGMGDDLYAEVDPRRRLDVPCRVYAPVGSHEDLLPYLVRRLLENGANTSLRQPHHRRRGRRSTT